MPPNDYRQGAVAPTMSDDPRIEDLLQELLESDRTPEDVCGEHPELLWEVTRRWQRCRSVEAQLDAIFPPSGPLPRRYTQLTPAPASDLPRIPGYEIQAVLGHGGMGVVYKARQLGLDRAVALKMLLSGAFATAAELESLVREARAVAGMHHCNIVQVHDFGECDGLPYFTMELMEGASLAQTLAGVPQPAAQAAAMVSMLARAVHAAHEAGIVHRDLKPANILLTSEGTPKISDFGLAKRFQGETALTLHAGKVGTPSYMAPEQARGKFGAVGPAADIYSLGAILYEMLSGRPPFKAETASETERQLLVEEPAPPSRLNARVPRDLETICLKSLNKDPQRRYPTAAALAEDIDRFRRGEPVLARRAGRVERVGKWVRRRPADAVAIAATLLLFVTIVGGTAWFETQQARRRHTVEADMREVTDLQGQARWAAARSVLERAEARLGNSGSPGLRRQLDRGRLDLDLVMQLDAIHLRRVTSGYLPLYQSRADREYAEAFRKARLGDERDPPDRVARSIKSSAVRNALVAALDDWSICTADQRRRGWTLAAARLAAAGPGDLRGIVQDPATWEDSEALAELAATAPTEGQSVSLLLAVAERLNDLAFMKRVQREYPADFWANLVLGNRLLPDTPAEAGTYYRAALASRPYAAVGYCAVGDALRLQNALDEAVAYYHKALRIEPNYARTYDNLGVTLQLQGHTDEALEHFRHAAQLDPSYAWAHVNIANTLRARGSLDEAFDEYARAYALDPSNISAWDASHSMRMQQGRSEELWRAWRKDLDANPARHGLWFGFAELTLFLGKEQEYRRNRTELLDRFGDSTNPWIVEKVSRACLLAPPSEDELRKAERLADVAVAHTDVNPAWVYPYFLFAKGLAEYRRGRFDSAISMMQGEAGGVMGAAPKLIVALAEHGRGQDQAAKRTLASAVLAFDWSVARALERDTLICHILRREAEAAILPNLPAFLRGTYQPVDNDERLALVGVCEFNAQYAAAARLLDDAISANPKLVKVPALSIRYRGARYAAMAARGPGDGASRISEVAKSQFRKQARQWLTEELAYKTTHFEGSNGSWRKELTDWQTDPALAAIRESAELLQLPPSEREECQEFWNAVIVAAHAEDP